MTVAFGSKTAVCHSRASVSPRPRSVESRAIQGAEMPPTARTTPSKAEAVSRRFLATLRTAYAAIEGPFMDSPPLRTGKRALKGFHGKHQMPARTMRRFSELPQSIDGSPADLTESEALVEVHRWMVAHRHVQPKAVVP